MVLLPSIQAVFPASPCYYTPQTEWKASAVFWRLHDNFQHPAVAAASIT